MKASDGGNCFNCVLARAELACLRQQLVRARNFIILTIFRGLPPDLVRADRVVLYADIARSIDSIDRGLASLESVAVSKEAAGEIDQTIRKARHSVEHINYRLRIVMMPPTLELGQRVQQNEKDSALLWIVLIALCLWVALVVNR